MSVKPISVFKALGDPVRWRIVQKLSEGPLTSGAVAAEFDQTRFGVMKHLEVLVGAGLVSVERRGRERWNHLNTWPLAAVLEALTNPLSRAWSNRFISINNLIAESIQVDELRMIHIRQEVQLPALPGRVYEVLTNEIQFWWGEPYLLTEGGRVTLEARLNGQLREESPNGHSAVWGRVEEVAPGRLLVLSGTIGMQSAVSGRVRIELAEAGPGTRLTLSHFAIGPISEEARERYAKGWVDLLDTRLRAQLTAA